MLSVDTAGWGVCYLICLESCASKGQMGAGTGCSHKEQQWNFLGHIAHPACPQIPAWDP